MAAAAAWWIASALLGYERPFSAPVAAVVALGVSYAARLRRVGEVVAGVALGVAVGDVFVRLAGTGIWQIALVIAVAKSLAVLLNAGPVLVTQAGVQASIVATLVPSTAADSIAGWTPLWAGPSPWSWPRWCLPLRCCDASMGPGLLDDSLTCCRQARTASETAMGPAP